MKDSTIGGCTKIATLNQGTVEYQTMRQLSTIILLLLLVLQTPASSQMTIAANKNTNDPECSSERHSKQRRVPASLASQTEYPRLPFTDLESFLKELKENLPGPNSEAFKIPSPVERETFRTAVLNLFQGDLKTAASLAAKVNYDLNELDDRSGKTYLILVERKSNFRGLGTYVVNMSYQLNVLFGVPHPIFDAGTLSEGGRIFQETGARGLFISGTHRCADTAPSPCTQEKTSACDGQFRISDVGHFTQTFFQEAHRAAFNLTPRPLVISLHANGNPRLAEVTLSNGTTKKDSRNTLVNRLRDALERRGVDVKSCNLQSDDNHTLCGTSNMQGRLFNNSPDACQTEAEQATGQFLHVEQHKNIRLNPESLIKALQEVLPKTR